MFENLKTLPPTSYILPVVSAIAMKFLRPVCHTLRGQRLNFQAFTFNIREVMAFEVRGCTPQKRTSYHKRSLFRYIIGSENIFSG